MATSVQGMKKPTPGSLAICLKCGGVNQYGSALELRAYDATGLEKRDPEAAALIAKARRFIKERAPS